jgi:uncharacterized protein
VTQAPAAAVAGAAIAFRLGGARVPAAGECDHRRVSDEPARDRTGREEAAPVTDNTAASRFELEQDGQLAFLIYRLRGDRLILLHTEVPEALGHHGLGGRLVRAGLERAAREGRIIVPLCPFARSYLEHNPDLAAGVTVDWGQNL